MPSDVTVFSIDNIQLSGFDAPEVIGDLGNEQKVAFHRFVGGVVTAQLLGEFPKTIEFTQILRGKHAETLIGQLRALTKKTQGVVIAYGSWSWLGVVLHVKVEPLNIGEIRYTVTYEPVQYLYPGDDATTISGQDLLNSALDLAGSQATAPTSQYSFDPGIPQAVSNLQQSTSQTLQASQNNLANVPASSIASLQSQVRSLQQSLAPLINSNDPQTVSAALELNNSLQHIAIALGQPVPLLREITVANPNLFILAAQYYSDASKWNLIAEANDLHETQLNGTYQLFIPEDPGRSEPQPATLM